MKGIRNFSAPFSNGHLGMRGEKDMLFETKPQLRSRFGHRSASLLVTL